MWFGSEPGVSYKSYYIRFKGVTAINGTLYKNVMKSVDS